MRGSVGAVVVVMVVVAGSCTGDDDPQAGDPSTAAAITTPAPAPSTTPADGTATSSSAPASTPVTSAAPSTTTPSEPPPPLAARRVVRGIPDDLSMAGASDLTPAERGRPFVLAGLYQAPGRAPAPRLWTSVNGRRWALAPAPEAGPDDRAYLLSATWFDGGLAVGGGTATDRPQAAVWVAANGRRFGQAEDPFGSDRAGVDVVGAVGTRLVAAGYLDDGEGAVAAVAVRGADGRWTAADVPVVAQFTANGIAARGRTVVVTGIEAGQQPARAAALVSDDAGRSFRLADTEAFRGGLTSELGPVAATPRGFVAVACAPTRVGEVTALARSRDGRRWTRQDIDVAGTSSTDRLSLEYGGCSSLTTNGETTIVGVSDLGGWVVYVNADGTALAREVPRRPGQVAEEPPLLAARFDGEVVAVGRDVGGFAPSVGDSLGTGLPDASVDVFEVELVRSPDGMWLGLDLYPRVTELGGDGWQRSAFGRWFVPGEGNLRLAPPRVVPAALDTAIAAPYGVVGVNDAAEDPRDDELDGPNRGTEAFLKPSGERWRTVGLIASGPGGDDVRALARSGRTVVGVGDATRREASGADVALPIAVSTRDGRRWRTEQVPVPGGGEAGLHDVCALASGQFVAIGDQIVDGVRRPLIVERQPDGRWRQASVEGLPERIVVNGCAADGDRVVVHADGVDRSEVYTSTGGGAFEPAQLDQPEFRDTRFADITAGDGTFYAAGSTYDGVADDAALWRSDDGLTWSALEVRGLGGDGDQDALSVVVSDGTLAVAGLNENAPVVWDVPLPR